MEDLGGVLVARRKVDLDHVVRALRGQPPPLLVVDDVIWRGNDVVEWARLRGVVAKAAKRLDVRHVLLDPSGAGRRFRSGSGISRAAVASSVTQGKEKSDGHHTDGRRRQPGDPWL